MANTKIRGITIELGADTSNLTKALKGISSELKNTDKQLNDINKLLKLDPGNVTLLEQKQVELNKALDLSRQKQAELNKLLDQIPTDDPEKYAQTQAALTRELEESKIKAQQYQKELDSIGNSTDEAEKETKELGDALKSAADESAVFSGSFKAAMAEKALDLTAQALQKVGGALKDSIKSSSEYADNMMVLSTQTGMSTDSLQEYSYMAELVDTDLSTITSSISKMKRNMDSASDGTGTAAEAFEKLGITVTDSNGELRDSNEVFDEAINALSNISNETERDAIAMNIFGKSAAELNPLIEAGSDTLDQFRQEAHDTGYVLNDETLGALGNVDDAFQNLSNVGTTITNQMGAALAPMVAEMTQAFVDWANSVDWVAVGNVITTVLKGIINFVGKVIDIFKKVYNVVKPIVEAIAGWFSNLKFEWPKIKLPHFGITPKGWKIGDLLKGTLPKLGIEWYGKGMGGLIMNQPTVFGVNNNGQLMAGGERGSEVVVGTNNLMKMIQQAAGGGKSIVVNVYPTPGMSEQAVADAVMEKIQFSIMKERSAW